MVIVKVSSGSLAKLGLMDIRVDYEPKTLYLLQYSPNGCRANCLFCTQSSSSRVNKRFLSRVSWYPCNVFELTRVLAERRGVFERICIQSLIKDGFEEELIGLIYTMRSFGVETSFSVCLTPVSDDVLITLRELGVDYVGVGLDTFTEKLFVEMKKPYGWLTYLDFIDRCRRIYGTGNVVIHLIAGLGENVQEAVETLGRFIREGFSIALFPYVDPVKLQPRVPIEYYRFLQIYLYLVETNPNARVEDTVGLIEEIIKDPDKYYSVFLTKGCPGCDRPYYTENPRGPFYNLYSLRHYAAYRDRLIRELKSTRRFIEGLLKNGGSPLFGKNTYEGYEHYESSERDYV